MTTHNTQDDMRMTAPSAPRITSRMVLLAAVWSFAVLSTGTKKPLEAIPVAAAPQVAVRVIATPAMAQFMAVRHVAFAANVSIQPATKGREQVISVEVDATPRTPMAYTTDARSMDHRVVSTR